MRQYEFEDFHKNQDLHFFDKETMRFFRSRILDWDYITGYFTTSEKNIGHARRYTLRKANFKTGDIETIGKFQAYNTSDSVKRAFNRALKGKL